MIGTRHLCHYVQGEPRDLLICGQPVTLRRDGSRSSWCAAHHAAVYVPARQGSVEGLAGEV